jgi:hypothetical protein
LAVGGSTKCRTKSTTFQDFPSMSDERIKNGGFPW